MPHLVPHFPNRADHRVGPLEGNHVIAVRHNNLLAARGEMRFLCL